jgi:NitT/TauT family transport system ATP-binding protein
MPWLSLGDNISLPLELDGATKARRKSEVAEHISKLGFDGLPLDRYPQEVSGGQRQKATICRSMIHRPELLLLDEPFSNLDFLTCVQVQSVIQSYVLENRVSTVLVSHDIDQLLYCSDRVIVLGGSPSRVLKEFRGPYGRPRHPGILVSNEFETFRNEVLEFEYGNYQTNIPEPTD